MTSSTVRVLHFDLFDQLRDSTRTTSGALTFHLGAHAFALQSHTPDTRTAARQSNAALALISAAYDERISHFVEVPEALFPADRLAHLRVTRPSEDPAFYLPELVWVGFYLPRPHRLRHLRRRLATHRDVEVPPALAAYGVQALPYGDAEQIWRDISDFKTPMEVAKTLVFHCPELASCDPYTATIVMEDHIESTANSQALNALATEISAQGMHGWYKITASTDGDGKPMTFGFDVGDCKAGEEVLIYKLSERTLKKLEAPVKGALRSASDDPRLQGHSWSVQPGVTAFHQPVGQPARLRSQRGGLTWTLEDVTPRHGLTADTGSIRFDDAKRSLSLEVKNHYLRTLGAYVQFFDVEGNVIPNPSGWTSQVPDGELEVFESDRKKFLQYVTSATALMGIPRRANTVELSIPFPNEAASAQLLFGGLGTSRWDSEVDFPGVIMTSIFDYGVPTVFLVCGAMMGDTTWVEDLLGAVAMQLAATYAGQKAMGDRGLALLPQPLEMMQLFGESMAGILMEKGMEKLFIAMTKRILPQVLLHSIPYVGWCQAAAAAATTMTQIGHVVTHALSSPATLQLHVKRTMDLRVVVRPDPRHGEAGSPETAVWPGVASRYEITVQYLGGTYFVKRGAMPSTTSNDPIDLIFEGVPAGGELQVVVGIHSDTDWLCGCWQSETVQALPPPDGTLTVEGAIEEMLVPLTSDTRYLYKEKIAYDAQRGHVWTEEGPPPSATVGDLSGESTSPKLDRLLGLTINLPAFQIGYAWKASFQHLPLRGQSQPSTTQMYAFQSLSVLADQSRLKFVNRGTTEQPALAYDTFTNALESRSLGAEALSQRNFYVYGQHPNLEHLGHLRQITLSDGNPTIDLTAQDQGSWGYLPLERLDDLVVHPSGYVVGVNELHSKLVVLELPAAAQPDRDAPVAAVLSGAGSRAGLLDQPCALSVTPDGRILVLERRNKRIQAFDTAGNPVPCFDGERLATFPAEPLSGHLDAGELSDELQAQFQAHGLSHRCELESSWQQTLDRGEMTDELREALALEGVRLTHDPERPGDPTVNARVEVKQAGEAWRIVDPWQSRAYPVARRSHALAVFDELRDVTIDVRDAGKRWIVTDHESGRAYHLQRTADQPDAIAVVAYLPFMPLHDPGGAGSITYLDVAVESKGYIYVLSHKNQGYQPEEFMLDLYEPNGAFLTRAAPNDGGQHLCAARIVVDLWRELFALSYEWFAGPGGRTEPTISHWIPTTPKGETRLPSRTASRT